MTTLARTERAALCDLLDEIGPDAPTLCEGWRTRDLAAHLVVRERRPDTGPGLVFGPLAGWTNRVRDEWAKRPYDELVSLVRGGPPPWSPFALPGADAAANTTEYFVHYEDVRRAQEGWEPRDLAAEDGDELWSRLVRMGRLLFRRIPVGVILRRTDTPQETAIRRGSPVATIAGTPGELTLYTAGRRDHAHVEVTGPEEAVQHLLEANLGL